MIKKCSNKQVVLSNSACSQEGPLLPCFFPFHLKKNLTFFKDSHSCLASSNAIICNALIFSIVSHLYSRYKKLAAIRSPVWNDTCSGVRL